MKRLFILVMLALLLVMPATAEEYDFQKYRTHADINSDSAWAGTYDTQNLMTSLYNDDGIVTYISRIGCLEDATSNCVINTTTSLREIAYISWDAPVSPAQLYDMVLWDSTGAIFAFPHYHTADSSLTQGRGRFELIREGQNWKLYHNGRYIQTIYTTAISTYGMTIQVTLGGPTILDNLIIGDSDPDLISGLPTDWYIYKDMITPSLKGIKNETANTMSTNNMDIDWTVRNAGTYTIDLKHVSSGTVINTSSWTATNDNSTGLIGNKTFDLSNVFFDSSALYGLYGLYLKNSVGSVLDTGYLFYTAGGATIAFDRDEYATGDTAIVTTSITGGYWDTAQYTYEGQILDLYGVAQDTWAVTSQTQSQDIDLSGYATGDYFAVLIATDTTTGTQYYMGYDFATINNVANIEGLTINAASGSLLSGVGVGMLQGTTWHNTTASGGIYNLSNFNIGSGISVNARKPTYNFTAFTFTPAAAGTYNLTLSLIPPVMGNSTATGQGSINGVVYEDWSHNIIPGATVRISNNTWTGTTNTSTASGYYEFHNLVAGISYRINSTATGYAQSADYSRSPIQSQAITQNCEQTPEYILGVECRDEETDALITASTLVETSDGQQVTTTNGRAQFTLDYGAYEITGTTDGYYVASKTALMTGDRNITLEFSQIASSSGAGVSYPSHNVKFTVLTFFGQPIAEANVTAQGYQTTVGPWEWLKTLLGIPLDETPIHNQTMEGTTDTGGQIDFMMIESVKYRMTFYKLGAINKTITIYPKDDYYVIFADAESFFTGGCNEAKNFNFTVSTSQITSNRYNVILNTTDALNGTTSCRLIYNRTAQPGKPVTIGDVTRTWTCNDTFQVWNTTGVNQSIIVHLNITHTSCGFVQRDYVITFKGAQVTMGLPADVLPWIAAVIIIFTALLFGSTSAEAGALVACFEGWIFYAIGWFDSMGNLTAITVLSLATVIAIMSLVMTRSRRERFV